MRNWTKRPLALLLALVMSLGLCACGGEKEEEAAFGEEEARTYVDGLMKASYLGQGDPGYLELVGGTEEEAEEILHNNLYLENQFFQWLWEIEYPADDLEEQVEDLFKEIYSHIQYQVTTVEKGEDDSFSVTVEIRPLNIINLVYDALTGGGLDDFYEKYPYEVQLAMDDEEYEAMDQEFAQIVLDAYKQQLPYIGYTGTRSVTVQLVKDENSYYYIADEDLAKINDLVIDYSRFIETEPEATPTPEETTTPEPGATPSGEPTSAPSSPAAPEPTPAPSPSDEDLHHVEIEVRDYGTITVELDASAAPKTVENFLKLAEEGFYDGLTFHRVYSGFMIQGGDPLGNGYGGSDETIYGEFAENGWENPISHTRGVISMARSNDPDSASSQFFIVHQDSTFLDGKYAAFGHVIDGITVVDSICADAKPIDDNGSIAASDQPIITSIRVID